MNPVEGLVSIITPTYNCGPFIAETVGCVRSQTYPNWEMLIIDDCSTDNTKEIVARFNDPRIKYYCLPVNSGAAVARNTALKMAQGRWIAFLDSDDLWKPDKLEKQIRFMTDNNIHFSYTQYEEMDEAGQSLGRIVSGPEKISKAGMFSYCWPGCLTVMYDNDTVGLIQIPPIKKNNDYALWLKAIRKANCHLLPENLAKYRKRTGSISREVESSNAFTASILTINNLFWGIVKKMVFVKSI